MFNKRYSWILVVVLLALSACQFGRLPAGQTAEPGGREQVATATVPSLATATHTPAATATPPPTETPSPRLVLATPTPTPQPALAPTRPAPEGDLPALPPDRGPLPALWTGLEFKTRNRVLEQSQGALNLARGPAPAGTYHGQELALDAGDSVAYVVGRCSPLSLSDTEASPTCISALGLAEDRVLPPGAVQLPAYVQGEGRLYVAGETLYLHRRWAGVLHALDRETLTVRETISDVYGLALDGGNVPGAPYIVTLDGLSRLGSDLPGRFVARKYDNTPVDMASAGGRVYVLTDTSLQVYDADLNLVATIQNPEGRLFGLTLDEGGQRLYVGSYDGLYALDLRSNELVRTSADVTSVLGVAVDAAGGRAFVLTGRSGDWFGGTDVVAVDTTNWQTETLLTTLSGQWRALAYDEARGRLLVASMDDHALIPIDLASGKVGPRLPLGIEVIEAIVSPADDRLYVSDSAGYIHVLDRRTYADVGRAYGGRHISLDAGRGRLYAGDERVPVVTVFDVAPRADAWLTVERTLPQPGKPRANPSTGEVVIVNRKFYVYDGATGRAAGELLPGVGEPSPECPGCYYTVAREVTIDAQRGLAATMTYTPWPGKPGPEESIAYDPTSGRAYYALLTGGYVRYASLAVYPDLGQLEARVPPLLTLEGLGGDIALDLPARRLYVARGDMLFVLDSETLNRVGRLYTGGWTPAIAAVDGELGRLYTLRGSEVLVWTRTGGAPPAPPPPEPMAVTNTVSSILPSPHYGADGTLLATIDGRLARSTDRGQTWQRLRGGLPEAGTVLYSADAAFSPDYANDRRIFAGVYLGDTHGEGVYCSEDGGDTWAWCGVGLYDLRVDRVVPSPAFAQDRTLIAYARTQSGEAVYRSTDAGGHWQLVLRQTDYGTPPLPRLEELLPPPGQPRDAAYPPQFRCDYQGACERSDDGGGTWAPLDTGGALLDRYVAYALSPHYAQDGTVYFLTEGDLYRVRGGRGDAGPNQAWSISTLPVMGRRDYLRYWASLAVAATGEDTHDLFLGSSAGEFYRFASPDLPWAAVAPVKVPPTIAPSPTACALDVDPRLQGIAQVDIEDLGCAVAPGEETGAAFQPFERGSMFWREDLLRIYVLREDGTWASYEDTWTSDQGEADLSPPQGLYAPVRGFGRVWALDLGGPPSPIGWGTARERGYVMVAQPFARGLLFSGADGEIYALYDDGTWQPL